jgi:Putative Actinobacterial Holin-X, holin superfamily III
MVTRETSRPIMSLMSHVASDLAYLVQTEIRLARSEIGEKVAAASNGGVYLATGAILALGGLIILLFDIAQWLTVAGLPFEWSLLIVAVVALVVGGIVAMVGVNRVKGPALVPQRTLEQMREDYLTAREHVR